MDRNTVDISLGKFCCKRLLKNGEGAEEFMHGSKGFFFLKMENTA